MLKFQVIGFALILGIVVAVVDYSMQAKKAGLTVAELGVSGYIETLKGRSDEVQEAKKLVVRQKELAKTHLPEAPDGWTRREWAQGDNSRILPVPDDMSAEEIELRKNPQLQALLQSDSAVGAQRKLKEIYVYERGDEIISIQVAFKKRKTRASGIQGMAMTMIKGNMQGMFETLGYAVVQGVAYGESAGMFGAENKQPYRVFSANMGGRIKFVVRANASDVAIRSMLDKINYDGLNAMLDEPLQYVGSSAPELDISQQAELAQRVLDRNKDETIKRGRNAEARLMGAGAALQGKTGDPVRDARRAANIAAGRAAAKEDALAASGVVRPEKIEVGLKPVVGMPGKQCERGADNALCDGTSN